jgi:hypothetical protein
MKSGGVAAAPWLSRLASVGWKVVKCSGLHPSLVSVPMEIDITNIED